MTLDSSTLIPLGVLVPILIWLGRVVIRATSTVTKREVELTTTIQGLRSDIQGLRTDIKTLAQEKISKTDFLHYMERLGYKNPSLSMPTQ